MISSRARNDGDLSTEIKSEESRRLNLLSINLIATKGSQNIFIEI